jgi:phosphopantetheinyl transferase (holo-ACP synthase)
MEGVAFTPEEQALLSSSNVDAAADDWPLRLWCAKEAVSKALGRGMIRGPQDLVAQALDARVGAVEIILAGEMGRLFPEFAGHPQRAYTAREGDFIVASCLIERSLPHTRT